MLFSLDAIFIYFGQKLFRFIVQSFFIEMFEVSHGPKKFWMQIWLIENINWQWNEKVPSIYYLRPGERQLNKNGHQWAGGPTLIARWNDMAEFLFQGRRITTATLVFGFFLLKVRRTQRYEDNDAQKRLVGPWASGPSAWKMLPIFPLAKYAQHRAEIKANFPPPYSTYNHANKQTYTHRRRTGTLYACI